MTGILQSRFRGPQQSTGFMLWQVTNAWQREIRAALAPFGLTHVQFVLLAVLSATDQSTPVTQRDLSDLAATDPMMTSQVLRTLEDAGLVERLPHPSDGRARMLAITPAGLKLVNEANRVVESADQTYFSPLGDDAEAFTAALATLSAAGAANGS